MITNRIHFIHRAASCSLAALVAAGGLSPLPARASDIEVFFTSPVTTSGVNPNIIFILDTSTSMWTPVPGPVEEYDPTRIYSATGCDSNAYYYKIGGGAPPTSCSLPKIAKSSLLCPAKVSDLEKDKTTKTSDQKVAEYYTYKKKGKTTSGWRTLTNAPVAQATCNADIGSPLPTTNDTLDWAVIDSQSITWYHPNYVAYLASAATGSGKPRIQVMSEAVLDVALKTEGINLSLMRHGYSSELRLIGSGATCRPDPDPVETTGNAGSGIVVMEMLDMNVPENQDKLAGKLSVGQLLDPPKGYLNETVDDKKGCEVPLFTPNGRTPLADTYNEAYAYYRGDELALKNQNGTNGLSSQFGLTSVDESRTTPGGSKYRSPIVDGCAKNYIVILSDGTTEQDNATDQIIKRLREPPGTAGRTFSDIVGQCDTDPELSGIKPTPSQCVDDLAEFMFKADASGAVGGLQNIKTFTIGFALDANAKDNAEPLLKSTATRGGGKYYEANDAASLKDVFDDIIRSVLTDNATFTAPAVTVDAFNRTRNLDDVYVSLFRPALKYRWPGNVKKFKVNANGDIVDVNGAPAVDPADGFLLSSSQSFWSDVVDGKDITLGGAAGEIPHWNGTRKIFVNFGETSNVDLTAGTKQLYRLKPPYDSALANFALGIVDPADTVTASDLVDWLYGRDLADANGDNNNTDDRLDMGDPLHSRPVVLVYGGTAANPDINDATLFVPTNDGFLHAFDTESGAEQWAFIPETLLRRARKLYENAETAPEDREYGLDGNIRLLIFDNNNNGVIEPADEAGKRDRAYLFFGMRRGGVSYYGLDVSVKGKPRLMWVNNGLPGAGESWSTPQPARVRVGAEEKIVLFMSGGYSTEHEAVTPTPPPPWQQYPNPDTAGNRIYMLDAFTGDLLWHAGPTSDATANLKLADMNQAFAADVRVVELSGDGYADRLYAADLGGRVWRFDIFNGQPTTSTTEGSRFMEGGVLASLGNAGDNTPDAADTRRFFYAPDAVPMELYGRSIVNIGIGSGHRELPATDTTTRNGFFSIRDYHAKTRLLSSQYKTSCTGATGPCHQIVSVPDLVDLTNIVGDSATNAVPDGATGWKIWLSQAYGEKVLSEARTLGGKVFFTTYEPTPREARPDSCAINFGTNKLYVVDIVDARPVYQNDEPLFNVDPNIPSNINPGGPPNVDTNGDGILDGVDSNGDGIADFLDTNGDGVADAIDINGDGIPDAIDTNGDGIADRFAADTNGDGIPDAYAIDTNGDGVPDAVDRNGDGVADGANEDTSGRYTELTQSGIASEVVFLFTDHPVPGTNSTEVFCLAGFSKCPPGLSVEPVRTYWRQRGVD